MITLAEAPNWSVEPQENEQFNADLFAEVEAALAGVAEAYAQESAATSQTLFDYIRPPESEIYGRSLTTIHRLGAFMVGKSAAEIITSPEAAQAKVEFNTSVEEGFGTDMELGGGLEVRDFDVRQVVDGKVLAKDLKTAISVMTEAGLVCGQETARTDVHFLPQLTRSKWDHKNALIVDQMARGETAYNTRIVVSPFPEEAAARSGDDYWRHIGYVPHLKRGFVQLYHVTETGTVLSGSLSFDGSDKRHLREVFEQYGLHVPEEELTDNWLQYALTGTLSEEAAIQLATNFADELDQAQQEKTTNTVDVTRDYGPLIDAVFNQSYVHICESLFRGRQTEMLKGLVLQLADKAQHFNERYRTALYKMRANQDTFTDDDSVVLHELLVYSTIEMMRALHLRQKAEEHGATYTGDIRVNAQYLQEMATDSFQAMLGDFGAEGAKHNRVYSACGTAINLGGDDQEGSPQATFGGVDAKGESSGKKLMNCPYCKAKVFDDPCAKVLACWDCRALVVNGKLVNKGNGGSKARAAARAAKQKAQEAAIAKQVDETFEDGDLAAGEVKEKTAVPGKAGQQVPANTGV